MKNTKNYILIFIISFVVIFLFSTSTSPLYTNYYEDDSAIFILMGKAIQKGLIPYKDIFDHKGPILFWIQALGQIIHTGREGIFFLQVLNFSITNILFYKIANIFCNRKKSIFSVLFGISFFALFIEEGNLSEEYSLIFIAFCIYIALKWIKNENIFNKKIYLYSFIYGVCCSIISLIRLNNAAPIVGILLGIIAIFIKNKKIKEIAKCGIFFITGIIIVYIPTIAYFYNKNALSDFIYGTFIHNFKYIEVEEIFKVKYIYSLHLPILALITFNQNKKTENLNILLITLMIFTYIILLIGPGFSHYYLITIPLLIVYISQIWNIIEEKKEISQKIILYGIVIFVAIMYMLIKIINVAYYTINMEQTNLEDIKQITLQIPENEKENIFVYNHSSASLIYLYTDIIPSYKYAFHQKKLFNANKKIESEMYEYIKENDIQWIIGKSIEDNTTKNNIDKYILNNYEIVDSMNIRICGFAEIIEQEVFLYKYRFKIDMSQVY